MRQFVLTFPFPLRFLLAAEPKALTEVLAVVQCGIATFLIRRAGFTVSSGAKTGAVTLYSVPPLEEEPSIPLLATMYGFSLHAGTVCEVDQRSKLERLCRYITRPPVAHQHREAICRNGLELECRRR